MVSDYLRILLLIGCLGLLHGCSTQDGPPTHPPEQTDPGVTDIERYLAHAWAAFDNDQLTTPVDDNAYLWYVQVLAIDNNNMAAHHGIADIVEKYLAWALRMAEDGKMRKALDYLNKAKSVDDSHPGIKSVEAHIANKSATRELRHVLDADQVRRKSPGVTRRLYEIAEEINRLNASIVITAPTDSLGRWLYQQLNNHASRRISATFEVAASAQITLQY